jgi:hypothetical protein
MNDRAGFDMMVSHPCGGVFEARQQAFANSRKELKMRNHLVCEPPLGHAEIPERKPSSLGLGGALRLWRSSSDSLALVRRRR